MGSYILRRLVGLVPLLLLVAIIAFILVRLTPGDPAAVVAGDSASPADVARIRGVMGLDRPLPVQFVRWMDRVFLHADLGESLTLKKPVILVIGQRVQPTALLTLFGTIVSVALGIPVGILAAIKRNSLIDRALMFGAIFGLSIPSFWLGEILVLIFALRLHILPPVGFESLQDGGLASLRYLVLPSIAIGISSAAFLARMVRSSMLDVLRQDYVRTAHAKGLPARGVILRHALKNAMVTPLTVIGLTVANLASGAVVIETVFNVPGAGRLLVNSVARRDYPVMQGTILIVAILYIFINLIVDILYGVLDPRVRYDA